MCFIHSPGICIKALEITVIDNGKSGRFAISWKKF